MLPLQCFFFSCRRFRKTTQSGASCTRISSRPNNRRGPGVAASHSARRRLNATCSAPAAPVVSNHTNAQARSPRHAHPKTTPNNTFIVRTTPMHDTSLILPATQYNSYTIIQHCSYYDAAN